MRKIIGLLLLLIAIAGVGQVHGQTKTELQSAPCFVVGPSLGPNAGSPVNCNNWPETVDQLLFERSSISFVQRPPATSSLVAPRVMIDMKEMTFRLGATRVDGLCVAGNFEIKVFRISSYEVELRTNPRLDRADCHGRRIFVNTQKKIVTFFNFYKMDINNMSDEVIVEQLVFTSR